MTCSAWLTGAGSSRSQTLPFWGTAKVKKANGRTRFKLSVTVWKEKKTKTEVMKCCLPSHHLSLQHQSYMLTEQLQTEPRLMRSRLLQLSSLPALTSLQPTQKFGCCGQLLLNATCSSGSLGRSNRAAQNYSLSAMEKMYLSQKLQIL